MTDDSKHEKNGKNKQENVAHEKAPKNERADNHQTNDRDNDQVNDGVISGKRNERNERNEGNKINEKKDKESDHENSESNENNKGSREDKQEEKNDQMNDALTSNESNEQNKQDEKNEKDEKDDRDEKSSHESIQEAVAKLSKVNKDTPFRLADYKKTGIFVIATVVMIVMLFMLGTSPKEKSAQLKKVTIVQDYQTTLADNLHHLQGMGRAKSTSDQKVPSFAALPASAPSGFSEANKAYLARQNAPSTVYSSTATFAKGVRAPGQAQKTFAGKGELASFGNQSGVTGTVKAKQLLHPRYTIASGEFMHAALESAINSDMPGQLRAVISQPVYAYIGELSLIPAGSRLIGQYSSSVAQGQNRIFVVWNRVILPNGITIALNSPGEDDIGRAGVGADGVNTHFFTRFGMATLLSIIGAGTANIGVGANDQYNSATSYRSAIANSFQQSANQSLQNSVKTKPTLTVHQGAAITVFVAHDLDFYSVRDSFAGDA